MLSNARTNEVASRRASEVVRGPANQPGPGDTLKAVALDRTGPLARRAPCVEIGEYRLAVSVKHGGYDEIGDYWLTKYYPGKFWDETAGWLDLKLTHDEVHKVNEAEQTNWGGSGSASFGLWKVGSEKSYESQKTMAKCDTEGFSISFELALIPLLRGWLDSEVFSSQSWRFDSGTVSQSENLSDGNIPPIGTMPMYPTGMVLARNVKINFNKSSELNKTFMQTVRSSSSVGWGPFSVRGNYYNRIDKSSHDFVEDTAVLDIKGMQVIGFICALLEKCPNPDDSLNW